MRINTLIKLTFTIWQKGRRKTRIKKTENLPESRNNTHMKDFETDQKLPFTNPLFDENGKPTFRKVLKNIV